MIRNCRAKTKAGRLGRSQAACPPSVVSPLPAEARPSPRALARPCTDGLGCNISKRECAREGGHAHARVCVHTHAFSATSLLESSWGNKAKCGSVAGEHQTPGHLVSPGPCLHLPKRLLPHCRLHTSPGLQADGSPSVSTGQHHPSTNTTACTRSTQEQGIVLVFFLT